MLVDDINQPPQLVDDFPRICSVHGILEAEVYVKLQSGSGTFYQCMLCLGYE